MRRLPAYKAGTMKKTQPQFSKAVSARRWQWCAVALGGGAIAALLYAFTSMAEAHMDKAREVSRDTQWTANAPVEGAHAAALLQGTAP